MEAALWGLLGTIAGAAASIATTVITARNAARLQLAAASLEHLEKSRAFQRDTLVELQDALHDELRAISLVYQADRAAFHAGSAWGSQLLGDELNMQAHLAGRRVLLLSQRVADDRLRQAIKELREQLTYVQLARDEVEAGHTFRAAMERGTQTMEQLGEVLRSLYPACGPNNSSKPTPLRGAA